MSASLSDGNVPELPDLENYDNQQLAEPLIAPLADAPLFDAVANNDDDPETALEEQDLDIELDLIDVPELDQEASDLVEALVAPYSSPYATPQLEGRDAAADAQERAAQQAKLDALHDESVLRNEERNARWARPTRM